MKDMDSDEAVARALFRAYDDATRMSHEKPADWHALGSHPTLDGWRAAARVAITLGAHPVHRDKRSRFQELLGTDSTNFLGTGLPLREFMQLHDAEKLARSWTLQPREEQRRRLAAVERLFVELARIRETTNFATRLAEMAIEAVIEGDWKMVKKWVEHFAFADEDPDLMPRYDAVYATFRELLLQVLRTGKEGPA